MWDSLIKILNRATSAITMLFLVVMVLIIFLQIISRAVIGSSFAWTEELARFLMIWVIFLGAGMAFQYASHISVDSLVERLSVKAKKIVHIFIALCSISLFLVMLVTGWEITNKMMVQKSPAMRLPMGYVYAVIPISAVLQILNIIDTTKKYLFKGKRVQEEV